MTRTNSNPQGPVQVLGVWWEACGGGGAPVSPPASLSERRAHSLLLLLPLRVSPRRSSSNKSRRRRRSRSLAITQPRPHPAHTPPPGVHLGSSGDFKHATQLRGIGELRLKRRHLHRHRRRHLPLRLNQHVESRCFGAAGDNGEFATSPDRATGVRHEQRVKRATGGGRFLRPVRPTVEALAVRGPSPALHDDDDRDRCRGGGSGDGAAGERAAWGDRRASREAEAGPPRRAEQRAGGDDWAGGGGRANVLREERPGGRQRLGGARQENGGRRPQPPGEDEGEPRKWKRWEAGSPAQEDAGRREVRRPALSLLEKSRGQDALVEADSPPRAGSRSFQRRGTEGSLQEEPAAQARRGSAKSLHEDARRWERRAAAAAGIPAFEKSRSPEGFFDSDVPLRAEPKKWEKRVEVGGSLREGSRRWERQAIAGGSVREKSRIWERLIEAESPVLEKSRSQSRPIEVNGSPREESRTWRGRIAIERFLREKEEPGTQGLGGSAGHRLGEPRGLERQGASTSLHDDSRRWKRQATAGVPLVEKPRDDEKRLHLEKSLLSEEAKGRARRAEAGGPLREDSSGSRRGLEAVLHDEPVTRGQRVLAGHALEEPRGVERRGVSSSLHEDSGRWKRQAAAGVPLVEKSREWERRMDPDGPPAEVSRSSRRTGATESFLQEEPAMQDKRGSAISLSEEPRRWESRTAAARIPVLEKSRSQEGLFDSDSPLHAEPRRWEKRVEAGGSLREESSRWKRQASPWGPVRDKSRQRETEADSSPESRKGTDNSVESVGRARVAQPSIRRPSQTMGDQPGSPEKFPRRDSEVLGSPRPGMLPARMRLAMLREKLASEGMILQDSKNFRRKSSVSTGNGNQSPGTGVQAGQDSPSAKESEEAETATKIGTEADTKTQIETRTETGTRTRARTDTETETKADTKASIETRPETVTKAETKTGTRAGTAIEAQVELPRGVKMRSGFASEGDRDRGQRSNRGVGVREETAPTASRTADLCSPTEDIVKQSARRIIGDYLTQPRPVHKPLHANDDGGGPEDAPREAKARPSGESGSGSAATSKEGVHNGGGGPWHGRRAEEVDVPASRTSRPTDDRSAAATVVAAHSRRRYRNGETPSPSRGEREGGTLNGLAGKMATASEVGPAGPADASDDSLGEGKIGREGKIGGRGSSAPKKESHVEGQGSPYRKVGLWRHGQMIGTEEVGCQEEGVGHEEALGYRKGHFKGLALGHLKGPALGHLKGPTLSDKEGLTFPQVGLREKKDLGNVKEGLRHVDGGERKEVRDYNMEGSTYQPEDKEGLKKEHLKTESPTSKQEGLSNQGSLKDNEREKVYRTGKTWVKSLQADDEGLVAPVRRRLRYGEELIASNDLDYKVKDAGDPEAQVDTKSQRYQTEDVGTKEDLSDEEAEDKDSSRYKASLVHVRVQPECNREDELQSRGQVHTGDGLSKSELAIDRRDPEFTQQDENWVGGSDSEKGEPRDDPGDRWDKRDQAIGGGDDESRRGYGLVGEEGEEEEEQRPAYEREDDARQRDGAGDSSGLTGDAQGMGDDYKQRPSTTKNLMEKEGFTGGEDVGLSHKHAWAHARDKESLADKAQSLNDGHTFKASVYNEQRVNEGFTDTDSPADNAHSPDSDYKHQASTKENQTEKEGSIDGDDLGLSHNKVWTHDPEDRDLTGKAQSLDDGYTFQESTRDDLRDREDFTDPHNVGPRHESDWARGTQQPREDDGEWLREEGGEPFIGEGPSDGNGGFEPKRGADHGEVKVEINDTSNDGTSDGTSSGMLRRSFRHSSSVEEEPAHQDEDGFGIDGGNDWEDVTARVPPAAPRRHPHGGDDDNAMPENVHNGGSGYEALGENSDGEGRDDDDGKSDAGHSVVGSASANAGSIPVFRKPCLADDDRTALENSDDGRPLPVGNKSRGSDSMNYRIGSRENDFIRSGESHGRAEPVNDNAVWLNGGTVAVNGTGSDNLPQTLDSFKDVDGTVVADEGRGGIDVSDRAPGPRANGADAPGTSPAHGDAASRGDSGSTSGGSSPQWVDYFIDSGSPDYDDVHGTFAHVPIVGPAPGGHAAPRDDGTNPFLFVHDAVAQEADADGCGGRGIWSALFAGGKPCTGRFFEGPEDDLENLPDWLRSIGPSPNPLPLPRSSRDRPPRQRHWQLYKFLPPIKEEVEIRKRPPPIVITPPAATILTAATAAAQKTPVTIPPALASNAVGSPLLPRTPTFDKYRPHENFSAVVSNSKQSYMDMISKIKARPSRFAKEGVYFQSKDGFGRLPTAKGQNYGYSFSRSLDSAEDLEEKPSAEEQVARED
ncbi:unnamed protein product [Lampetra fluviatilis]